MNSKALCHFILFMLFFTTLITNGLLYADEPIKILTPRGSEVPNTYTTAEHSAATITYLTNQFRIDYPGARIISDASRTYNCHGYAWRVSEGYENVWIGYSLAGSEEIFWSDGSYDEVDESVATKVSYSGDHSAITTGTPGVYISKWRDLPLVEHAKDYVPSGYGNASQFFRRSVDVPLDFQSINDAISNAAAGQTSIVEAGSYSLSGNIDLPSDVTLELGSGAEVSFGGYYIAPGAGSFSINNGATVDIKDGSNRYWGLYTSLQTACDNVSSGQTISLLNNSYNEGFSLSGKSSVSISGNGATVYGGAGLNNSSYCSISGLHMPDGYSVYVNGGTSSSVSNIQSDNSAGTLSVYGATSFAASGISSASSGDVVCNVVNSTGDIYGSGIENSITAVLIYDNAWCNVTDNYFCQNNIDIYADGSGYGYALHNTYSSYYPNCVGGNVSYIMDYPERVCSAPAALAKEASSKETQGNIAAKSDETELAYLELLRNIHKDKIKDISTLKTKYKSDFDKIILKSKDELSKATDKEQLRKSLSILMHCYKSLNENDTFTSFINALLETDNIKSMYPYVKRYLIDSYIETKDFKGAAALADEILNTKDIDQDLTCEMFYEKGVINKYFLKNNSEAYRSFSMITSQYPKNPLARMAKVQMSDLPKDTDRPYLKSLAQEPDGFKCSNYPNPFNPATRFNFSIPKDGYTELKIYNSLGQEVKTLVSEQLSKGQYSFEWNANSYASGIYYYTLKCTELVSTHKMILMK